MAGYLSFGGDGIKLIFKITGNILYLKANDSDMHFLFYFILRESISR